MSIARALSRRDVLRTVGAGAVTCATLPLWLPGDAEAATSWCRRDPDVLLEGTFVRVDVAVPDQYLALVNGPTWLRFNLPSQVDRQFVWADAGFNNLGYDVTFSTAFQPNKPCAKFSVNLTIKVPIWCSATPDNGTTVERTGNDATTGTSLNVTVYGSL